MNKKFERFVDAVEVKYYVPVFARKCLREVSIVLNGEHKPVIEFLRIGSDAVEIDLIRRIGGTYVIRNVVLDGVPITTFEANRDAKRESRDSAIFAIYGDERLCSMHALMPYAFENRVYDLVELCKVVARLLCDIEVMNYGFHEVELCDTFEYFTHVPLYSVSKRAGIGASSKAHNYMLGSYTFTFRHSSVYPEKDAWNVELAYCGRPIDDHVVESRVVASAGFTNREEALNDLRKLCKILEPEVAKLGDDELVDFVRQKTAMNCLYNYEDAMMLLNRAEKCE